MPNLNAKQSFFQSVNNLLTGSNWCGKWELKAVQSDSTVITEIIPFDFDTSSVVTTAIATQLANVGVINSVDTIGDPIFCINDIMLSGINELQVRLKVWDCSKEEIPDDCAEAWASYTFQALMASRLSSVDQSDLLAVSFSPSGSLRCEGTPADLMVDKFTYPVYGEDAYRTYLPDETEISRVITGPKIFLFDVCIQGNTIVSFNWSGSVVTNTADQALIEALVVPASGGFTINKFDLDSILKGRVRPTTATNNQEGSNFPQLATDGWNIVGSGTPWLRNAGISSQTLNWTAQDGNTYLEYIDNGIELVLQDAIMTQMSGMCIGEDSAPETNQYYVCKAIKRYKANASYFQNNSSVADSAGANGDPDFELQGDITISNSASQSDNLANNPENFDDNFWQSDNGTSSLYFGNGSNYSPTTESFQYDEYFPPLGIGIESLYHINLNFNSNAGINSNQCMFVLMPNFFDTALNRWENRQLRPRSIHQYISSQGNRKVLNNFLLSQVNITADITITNVMHYLKNLNTNTTIDNYTGNIAGASISNTTYHHLDRIHAGDIIQAEINATFTHDGNSYTAFHITQGMVAETF